jgi:CheY-like chemotaxis protein
VALKILLADDSMTAQKLGLKILTEAGHEVIAVSNGAAAFKRISEHKPDLLLLDVFMPGYSGPEVCQKVRAGGSNTPVLLTVGQMEHFDPADAERVKADGVIVKPFVAKDLEDLVAKIEQKLKAPPAAEPYQPTQKMEAHEFQDASYEEWKVTAEGHGEGEAQPAEAKLEVPENMASSSAFGDMLGEETPEPAPAPATQVMTPPTQVMEAPPAEARSSIALEPASKMAAVAEPELETYVAPAPAHEIEFTSAPKAHEAPADGKDPGLITDATEMASAFPTKFGIEGAEIVPVGVAADMPELYTDSQAPAEAPVETPMEAEAAPTTEISPPAVRRITEEITAPAPAEADSGWSAPAETVATEATSQSLEQEMQQAFANVPVDTQPPVEELPPPPPVEAAPPAPAPAANVPDPLLAAAMEAAVAGAASPTITLDANTIANIVHRVTERMKPELINEIARELASEAERTRKP